MKKNEEIKQFGLNEYLKMFFFFKCHVNKFEILEREHFNFFHEKMVLL